MTIAIKVFPEIAEICLGIDLKSHPTSMTAADHYIQVIVAYKLFLFTKFENQAMAYNRWDESLNL